MAEALASTRAGHDAAGDSSRLPMALLMQVVRAIAGTLRATRVDIGGDIGWTTAAPRDDGADLYAGTLGIAVFLAAYARADGRAWARDLALRAIAPARRAAQQDDATDHVPLGGLVGRGAQIYALVTIGQLLDEPALHREAHHLATALAPRWIRADRSLDVVHGSAGLILALLSLGPALDEPGPNRRTPLAHVRAASSHLVDMQRPPGAPWAGAVLGWSNALPQSGFAHGATGIAAALARAGQALEDDTLYDAAARALAFERAHLLVAPGRWRMAPGDPRTPVGWCRGAPGAALGRAAVLQASDDHLDDDDADAAHREIAESLALMQRLRPLPLDHLCCGGMSVVDALLSLSTTDASGTLLAAAHRGAASIFHAASTRGHFVTGTDEPTEPSLFQGLAGVGYAFLRLIDPSTFPCLSILASAT